MGGEEKEGQGLTFPSRGAGAIAGAGAGGATGTLVGALVGAGIPEHRAAEYERGLRAGGMRTSYSGGALGESLMYERRAEPPD
jgi:hypothetical protein